MALARLMFNLWQDLRYATRLLLKAPAFTGVAVATLALGIGANAAIFSVADAALLNPLPFPQSDRLVALWETVQRDTVERREFSYPDYRDVHDRNATFDAIAAWAPESFTLSTLDAPARQVDGELASAGYVEMLGAAPVAGRAFTRAEDEERGAHPVALVSYPFAQRELGGVPASVGRSIVLNDRAFTVIGVLPKGFKGLNDNADVWIPMGMLAVAESPRAFDQRGSRWHQAVARLKPGISLPQANADLAAIAHQLGGNLPTAYGLAAFGLKDETVGQLAPLLLTLLAAVGFVLLIACVNLANLLLARATTRQRETAIRAALGADRRRLARQFLAEGVLLSGLGAASGLLLSLWGVDAITALAPARLPSFVHPHLDWRVLLFVAAVTCGAGLLLGLLPALQGSRPDLNGVLKDGARGSSGGQARARLRSALVVAEVALSLLLLAGAGLMVKSFLNLQRIDVGFRPQRVMTMKVALPEKDAGRLSQVANLLVARIGALPLVEHVALATDAPFSGDTSASYLSPEGSAAGVLDPGIRVYHHGVTPGFFAALGAGLLEGRDVDAHDTADARPVAVVSHRFASKAWPGVDAVGRRFTIGRGAKPTWFTVVGVAPDLRYRSVAVDVKKSPEDPDVYFPLAQRPSAGLSVLVSSSAHPVSLIAPVREAVHAVDRDIPTFAEGPLADLIAADTATFRLSANVMSLFGAVALLLAAVGVYGLINYSVTQRRQEIGVRLALGARRREIYGMVLKDAVRLTIAGIVIGVAVALPAARLLGAQLYGITTSDPWTYASIVALLLTVAIGAALLPARRAARLDPIVALRME